jgi:Flp pilus assembly protein TadD
MRARRAAGLAIAVMLASCAPAPPPGPYPPGADPGQPATVDPLLVGHRLMDAGEYDLAHRAYTRAGAAHGLTAEVLAGLGSANLALGRLGTAERLLRRATESDEATPEMWNNLGVVLVERGEFLEAEQMLRRAYALDNGASDAIRDNLRLALAKSQDSGYDASVEQEFKVVRRGGGQYLLRKTP